MTDLHYPAYIQIGSNHYRERFGLSFEDFQVGQTFKHRPGYTFTQQDNSDECLDTLNQAMLHYDQNYAAQTEFKKPLMVTTTIVQRLIGMTWKTFNHKKRITQWQQLNMLAPVYDGDTLYAESEVLAINEDCKDSECGLLTVALRSYKPDDTKTCEMIIDILVYKADHLPFTKNNY